MLSNFDKSSANKIFLLSLHHLKMHLQMCRSWNHNNFNIAIKYVFSFLHFRCVHFLLFLYGISIQKWGSIGINLTTIIFVIQIEWKTKLNTDFEVMYFERILPSLWKWMWQQKFQHTIIHIQCNSIGWARLLFYLNLLWTSDLLLLRGFNFLFSTLQKLLWGILIINPFFVWVLTDLLK